jgi:hypothetical protein
MEAAMMILVGAAITETFDKEFDELPAQPSDSPSLTLYLAVGWGVEVTVDS